MQGMTTKQTHQTVPQSFERPVLAEGFDHVFGTGGIKTATRCNKGGNAYLIKPDEPDENLS
jgi:hypothetical protein